MPFPSPLRPPSPPPPPTTTRQGELTKRAQGVVSGACMARYAAWLGLHRYVVINPLRAPRLRLSPSVLGDSFEALVAALFLDQVGSRL